MSSFVRILFIIVLIICCINAQLPMPLRNAADIANIFIGTSVNYHTLHQDEEYATVLKQQYSLVTAENSCKWHAIEPQYDVFNFTACDYIQSVAQTNNQTFRGHNLCWNNDNPPWLQNGNWTESELIQILQNHITTVMQHYGTNSVYAWDVVNEAVNNNPTKDGLYRKGVWYPTVPNYVDIAFETARKANPDTKLFYNDYLIFSDAQQYKTKSDAVYNMIKQMKDNDVPIDGVGFQCHLAIGSNYPLNYSAILDDFERFAALEVEIHITEMTVCCGGHDTSDVFNVHEAPPPCAEFTPTLEKEQAEMYAMVVRACMATRPHCKSMETWSYTDKYPGPYGSDNYPLPWDTEFQPKTAAYYIEQELLKN
eukprot:272534_1